MTSGCLLLHGFTATPPVMGFLQKRLEENGFTVENPLLAGHGGDWADYEKCGWPEWYQSVREAYDRLCARVRSIVVAGQSLGGLLALKLALDEGEKIEKVACLATPLYLDGFLARFLLPVVSHTPLKKIYRFQSKSFATSLKDSEALRQFRKWSHPKMPIKGILSIRELQDDLRPRLKKLTTPLLIVYSKQDPLISQNTARFYGERFQNRKIVVLERSGHIISMDYEKEVVASKMILFFRQAQRAAEGEQAGKLLPVAEGKRRGSFKICHWRGRRKPL